MKTFSMALIVQKKESSTRSSLKTASTRQTDLTVFSLFLQNAVVVYHTVDINVNFSFLLHK